MKINGFILNYDAKPVSEVKIEIYGKDTFISDIYVGNDVTPIKTIISDINGKYEIELPDNFTIGYVVVPTQIIKNYKVDFNYAAIDISRGVNYNVVIKITKYDIHDINLDGKIDIDEIIVWIRNIEDNKFKDIDYRLSQIESKFRMLVEIIIPLILKK